MIAREKLPRIGIPAYQSKFVGKSQKKSETGITKENTLFIISKICSIVCPPYLPVMNVMVRYNKSIENPQKENNSRKRGKYCKKCCIGKEMEFIRRNGGNPEKTMVLWKKMLYNFLNGLFF